MKSNCVSRKSSPYPPRLPIFSPPFKNIAAPKTNLKTNKNFITVDQMLNDPNIFLNQLYCRVRSISQKKQKTTKRNIKSLNESMFIPLNTIGRNYEDRGSVKEITRPNSKSSLYDPDKTRSDIEEIMNSNEITKDLLKKLNYKITTEDFYTILKTLIEDIDWKDKLIEGYKNMIKTNTNTITNLEIKLKTSKKEIESMKKQLDDTLNQVKELLYLKRKSQTEAVKLLSEKKLFHNKIPNNPLEEAIKLLQPNTSHELLQSLEEINRMWQRMQETTHFVNEVTELVKQGTNRAENLEDILAVIKRWVSERNECGKILLLRNNLCRVLYGITKEVTDKEIVILIINNVGRCGN